MKSSDRHADRPLPGKLPLFPEPYPGESFYSILCRYHVRSGNINSWHTIRQLFGYNSSLLSTLLTPFHLEMAKYWMPGSPNIQAEVMLRENTAFNVYALGAAPYEIDSLLNAVIGKNATGSLSYRMQPNLISHVGRLRFCPECAAEQRKIYGEPYWQVLFQLDEVEYCPLHKIRLRSTPIPYKSIRDHFYPASLILSERSSMSCETETVWDDLFRKEKDFFIKLSQNIAWILQNGMRYESYYNLCKVYARITGKTYSFTTWYSISLKEIIKVMEPISHGNILYRYVAEKNASRLRDDAVFIYSLKICSHILLMTALFGHPKAFYEGI